MKSLKKEKVTVGWVPSHFGIHDNNKADMAAKSTLQFEVASFTIPYTELKCLINVFLQILFNYFLTSVI